MTFYRELDEMPWEVVQSVADRLPFNPKVFGENVQIEPEPVALIFNPQGTQIASVLGEVTSDGDPVVSRVLIPIPAIETLDEDYSVRITWSLYGETDSFTETRLFDVVKYPFGNTQVSLNNLLEERPDCGYILDRLGELLGYAESDARARMAAICAVRARVELDAMLRSAILADGKGTRPRLILDRSKLGRLERYLALAGLYESVADNPIDGEGANDKPAQFYRARADAAFRALGPLKYDANEDLVADTEIPAIARVTFTRRVQG